jgi:hypothetical protein
MSFDPSAERWHSLTTPIIRLAYQSLSRLGAQGHSKVLERTYSRLGETAEPYVVARQ